MRLTEYMIGMFILLHIKLPQLRLNIFLPSIITNIKLPNNSPIKVASVYLWILHYIDSLGIWWIIMLGSQHFSLLQPSCPIVLCQSPVFVPPLCLREPSQLQLALNALQLSLHHRLLNTDTHLRTDLGRNGIKYEPQGLQLRCFRMYISILHFFNVSIDIF